jgi:hypothetical protein
MEEIMHISKEPDKRRLVIELGPTTLLGLLQIPLICLKLTTMIAYPWWVVLLPTWSMFAMGLVVFIIAGIMWIVKNTLYFHKK